MQANDKVGVTGRLSLSRPRLLYRGPSRSLLPQYPLAFSLLDLLQQGPDVAWQGLPQGILVDPLEIPTDAEQEISV
jgi:hypothetical protein